ncbi:LysR family transcriptional regulator [Marinomonas sp. 2405UD66-6]|uniref:LysR family transcriptional regulator n=1 Tax=Marinomonas sp. 2405UD66-6 TaxID=3391834 RepID=UPI0039C9F98E
MDTELLKTLVAIVDHGSFQRAAMQTFRTPSAISMQMKRLEEHIGAELFTKQGREQVLTEKGQQLVGYARQILQLQESALQSIVGPKQNAFINLGCPNDYVSNLLVVIMSAMESLLPSIQFRIRTGTSIELRELMDKGEIDLALVTRTPGSDEGLTLFQDKGVWVAKKDFDWQSLSPLPLALYESGCKFHSSAIDGFQKKGMPYQLYCVTSNLTLIESLLMAEKAISAIASISVNDALEIIESDLLPNLPSVEIAFTRSASAPDWLTVEWVESVIENVIESTGM